MINLQIMTRGSLVHCAQWQSQVSTKSFMDIRQAIWSIKNKGN